MRRYRTKSVFTILSFIGIRITVFLNYYSVCFYFILEQYYNIVRVYVFCVDKLTKNKNKKKRNK